MLEVLRYSVPLCFVILFAIFIIVFTVLICKNLINNSKNLRIMIDFFGKGFNYRKISRDELSRIFSFCKGTLVKYHKFYPDPTNDECNVVSFYKEIKKYDGKKTNEILRIQLVTNSSECSMNIICIGSNNIIKDFLLFYNFTSELFKETKTELDAKHNGCVIKIINTPSYVTEFGIEPQYIEKRQGFEQAFRSNIVLKQKDSLNPIIKPITTSNKEPVAKEPKVEVKKVEPVTEIEQETKSQEITDNFGVRGERFTPEDSDE